MTLPEVAEALAVEMERTVSAFENRDKGGMQVPFHGDFASAPPSVIGRFRWWAREMRAALAATSAPAPVPEAVVGAISELEAEVSGGAGCDDQRCPVDHIAEAKRLRTGLLSAISRALAEAREGALREAATELEGAATSCDWRGRDAVEQAAVRIRALASPPPAHEEGGR